MTDSWRLFWFSRALEEPADRIATIALDPETGELTVHLVRIDLDGARRRRMLSSLRLRQDLYDLMMRIWNSQWISPYSASVRSLAVIVYSTSVDTFGVLRARPVAKSSLPIGYFQKSERAVRELRDLPFDLIGSDPA